MVVWVVWYEEIQHTQAASDSLRDVTRNNMDSLVAQASAVAPPAEGRNGLGMTDVFGFIYTSGTTGLPKAAVIQHAKIFTFGHGMAAAFQVKPDDVVLTVLPLFHSAGGGLGAGMMVCVCLFQGTICQQ